MSAVRKQLPPRPAAYELRLHQRAWGFYGICFRQDADGDWVAQFEHIDGVLGRGATRGEAQRRALERLSAVRASAAQVLPIEQTIVIRPQRQVVHRGCCDRCDRCGSPFQPPGSPGGGGCRLYHCAQPRPPKPLACCPSCGRRYEPLKRPEVSDEQVDFRILGDDFVVNALWDWPAEAPMTNARITNATRKWTQNPRATTLKNKPLTRKERRESVRLKVWMERVDEIRPRTRSQCKDGPRPCIFVACKYNLFLDVNPETGSIRLNFPHLAPTEMAESCARDVQERGGITLEELGAVLNISLEGARQVEVDLLGEIRAKLEGDDVGDADVEVARLVALMRARKKKSA